MGRSRREAILAAADILAIGDDHRQLAQQLVEIAATLPGRTHGIRSTYVAGCRCDACTAANTTYVRVHRHQQRATHQ